MSVYNIALVRHVNTAPNLYLAPLGIKLEAGDRVQVENRYGYSDGVMAHPSFQTDSRGLEVLRSLYGKKESREPFVTGVYRLQDLTPKSEGTTQNGW